MIFKQLYETKLTTTNIESWIDAKMSKSTGLFGIREYSAKAKEDGFMIRKRRLTKADVFYPRVIAKYCKPSTRTMLSIRIIPSYTSIIFFLFSFQPSCTAYFLEKTIQRMDNLYMTLMIKWIQQDC